MESAGRSTSFCVVCDNLLRPDTSQNVQVFRCRSCLLTVEAKPEDTLRFEDTSSSNIVQYQGLIRKAAQDPMNRKVKKECPKCGYGIATNAILGEELRSINSCVKCEYQWV